MYNYVYQGSGRETGSIPGYPTTRTHMIYTDQENDWLSRPAKKNKRVSNQTQDGSAPGKKDMRKHDWAITTTIEVNGKTYIMPVQV